MGFWSSLYDGVTWVSETLGFYQGEPVRVREKDEDYENNIFGGPNGTTNYRSQYPEDSTDLSGDSDSGKGKKGEFTPSSGRRNQYYIRSEEEEEEKEGEATPLVVSSSSSKSSRGSSYGSSHKDLNLPGKSRKKKRHSQAWQEQDEAPSCSAAIIREGLTVKEKFTKNCLPSFYNDEKHEDWSFGPLVSLLLGLLNHLLILAPNAAFNILLYMDSFGNVIDDSCTTIAEYGDDTLYDDCEDYRFYMMAAIVIPMIIFAINTYFSYGERVDKKITGHSSKISALLDKPSFDSDYVKKGHSFLSGLSTYFIAPVAAFTKLSIQSLSFGFFTDSVLDALTEYFFGKSLLSADLAFAGLLMTLVAALSLPTVYSFFKPEVYAGVTGPQKRKKLAATAYSMLVTALLLSNQYNSQEKSEHLQIGLSEDNIEGDLVFGIGGILAVFTYFVNYFTYKNRLHGGFSTDYETHKSWGKFWDKFWEANRTLGWPFFVLMASLYKGFIQGLSTSNVLNDIDDHFDVTTPSYIKKPLVIWAAFTGFYAFFCFAAGGKYTEFPEMVQLVEGPTDAEQTSFFSDMNTDADISRTAYKVEKLHFESSDQEADTRRTGVRRSSLCPNDTQTDEEEGVADDSGNRAARNDTTLKEKKRSGTGTATSSDHTSDSEVNNDHPEIERTPGGSRRKRHSLPGRDDQKVNTFTCSYRPHKVNSEDEAANISLVLNQESSSEEDGEDATTTASNPTSPCFGLRSSQE